MQRTARIVVMALFVLAATALAGCGMLGKATTQTITDAGNSFHFEVPASWTATTSPGFITLYGGDKMPAVDAAIDKEPWYFVLSSDEIDKELPVLLKDLAEARAKSRKWTKVTLGKPVKTTLGNSLAYEMDVAATDELKRSFEGKLLLARRGGKDVLIFAFTKPGAFKGSKYEDLKKNFFWLVGSDDEMTATDTVKPKKDVKELEKETDKE